VKTYAFLLATCWGLLMNAYGVSPTPEFQQTGSSANAVKGPPGEGEKIEKSDVRQQNRDRASTINRRPHIASPASANHPKPLPPEGRHPRNAKELLPPLSEESKGKVREHPILKQTFSVPTTAQSPSTIRPVTGLSNNPHNIAPHRSPNPPVVGGPANSDRRNGGAINGTRMTWER